MIDVKFYLNNSKSEYTTIYAIVHEFGKRYKWATGIRIKSDMWNQAKMMCRYRADYTDASLINDRIEAWRNLTEEVFADFMRQLIIPSRHSFRAAMKERLQDLIHQEPDKKITELVAFAKVFKDSVTRADRTLVRYQTTIMMLEKFEKHSKRKIHFEDVDINFYESFRKWMYGNKASVNYFGDMIKNIKVFMNEAADRGLHNNAGHRTKKFKVVSEETDSIYLSVAKLKTLHALKIDSKAVLSTSKDKRAPSIERRLISLTDCRDRFLIGAFTGLRYSDFILLDGIKSTDEYISNRAIKTGNRTKIPMHPIIREILIRRENKLPAPVSNQKMNSALHILCQMAGFTDVVEITRTEGGRLKTFRIPEYKLVTTHTARRSACTNMYLAGIPIKTIMSFSGHKTITSFMKYIKMDVAEDAIRMKEHPFFQ
ncbi:MAG: site-specific recombinase XerD [Bacteroidetes bacterium]|nr:MAG: site-specific recombinase XerD [Bacteroidota bacterium]